MRLEGTAKYYHVDVDGEVNENAPWFYPQPKEDAKHLKGYIAFWHGVQVQQ